MSIKEKNHFKLRCNTKNNELKKNPIEKDNVHMPRI